MPKITIDGREVEVAKGKNVLQAALENGAEIPHYCYHPGLSVAGNCRMCLVEIEKMPKLAIACATEAAEGMVVRTNSEKVKQAQRHVMEFLLVNHPLDCPICDQAGECRLQEYAVDYGTGVSRLQDEKLLLKKAVDIGEHIMLDQERCIHCSRCIRFCDEVSKTGELAFFQRGAKSSIGIYPGNRLDNPYSGNVADICPVGALTLKEFRFQTRVWYLKSTPSVCAGCSKGCNVEVSIGSQQEIQTTPGQYDDRIKRMVPRFNDDVNGYWMCDEGRLSYRRLEAAPRIETAQSPLGTEIDWERAVDQAASALKDAAKGGRAAVIFSPRLVNESLFAWRKLFDGLGEVKLGVASIVRGEDDDNLIRADKGANSTGVRWILDHVSDATDVLQSVERGEVDTLVVLGDVLDPGDTVEVGEQARARLKHLVYVGAFADKTAERASLVLPGCSWSEEDGTMTNCDGRVQQVRRCHRPRGEGRPGWRIVADLAAAAGVEVPAWGSDAEVLEALAAENKAFGEMKPPRERR